MRAACVSCIHLFLNFPHKTTVLGILTLQPSEMSLVTQPVDTTTVEVWASSRNIDQRVMQKVLRNNVKVW